jgi:hypothetical protein
MNEQAPQLRAALGLAVELLGTLSATDAAGQAAVAAGDVTVDEIVAALAAHPSNHVVHQVADDPEAPEAVLASLVNHPDVSVRWYLAKNPSVPTATLLVLADDDEAVRCVLARRVPLEPEVLTVLSGEGSRAVIADLSENTSVPDEARVELRARALKMYAH